MDDADEKTASQTGIDNRYIGLILKQIADVLEFADENAFKIRSYRMAGETVEAMGDPVVDIAREAGAGGLQKIPGIGKTISGQIMEIIETGRSTYLEELAKQTPLSVLELRRVSGIGLKTAQTLYRDFGIQGLDDLKTFAEGGGLLSVPGLGEKSSERIRRSLQRLSAQSP